MTVNTTVNPEVRGGPHDSRLHPPPFRPVPDPGPRAGRGARPPALGGPGPALRSRIHGDPGHHRGERGAPVHRPGDGPERGRATLGRHRLCADDRRPDPARRPGRRPPGPQAGVPGRAGPVHGRVPGQRPGPRGWPADRRPGRAGTRRRAAHPRGPVGHHRDVRGRTACRRAQRLGSAGCRRGRGRRAAGRRADHLARLAVGVPDQRAGRRGGLDPGRAPDPAGRPRRAAAWPGSTCRARCSA